MEILLLTLIQLSLCLINIIGGTKLLKPNNKFKHELIFIFSFCVMDFITSLFSFLVILDILPNKILDYSYLIFIWTEIILLPGYISSIIESKHNWVFPISLVLSTIILSYFFSETIADFLQLFSGIYITFYCLKYLKWLFTNDNILEIRSSMHFWIIIGIMFCYTASIPSCLGYFLLESFGNSINHTIFASALSWLYVILNITMHCFFIKAFIWKGELK